MMPLRRAPSRARRRVATNDHGMVTAFVIIMSITLVSVATFSWQVGGALAQRRQAFSVAQAAARAAVQVDEAVLRSGAPIDFNNLGEGPAAQARANAYLALQEPCASGGCSVSVSTGPTANSIEVVVSVQGSIFGNPVTITGTGTAQAQRGVLSGA